MTNNDIARMRTLVNAFAGAVFRHRTSARYNNKVQRKANEDLAKARQDLEDFYVEMRE